MTGYGREGFVDTVDSGFLPIPFAEVWNDERFDEMPPTTPGERLERFVYTPRAIGLPIPEVVPQWGKNERPNNAPTTTPNHRREWVVHRSGSTTTRLAEDERFDNTHVATGQDRRDWFLDAVRREIPTDHRDQEGPKFGPSELLEPVEDPFPRVRGERFLPREETLPKE
jgi:hypothetical protein